MCVYQVYTVNRNQNINFVIIQKRHLIVHGKGLSKEISLKSIDIG